MRIHAADDVPVSIIHKEFSHQRHQGYPCSAGPVGCDGNDRMAIGRKQRFRVDDFGFI